ncbi:uncharacterized protein N7483_007373 [Penicillium malachiteum]|uniref:uncharacterized protein n=1 Tax=Penicillium malachiteum TaxID=1324776 RepID=UPI002548C811|nr:uncharacterized protein N7483_007373 [Penicillium malachiteum]KAJ5726016.1 hypothetical protein N7483_007373 [Penicillium malachiteum]
MVYPHCIPERFLALQACMHWLVLMDDVFASPTIQNHTAARMAQANRLNAIIDGIPIPSTPTERVLNEGLKLFAEHQPTSVLNRMAEDLKAVLKNCANENTDGVGKFTDLESYDS